MRLAITEDCVLACSEALRNIPQEANYIPSVSSAHVSLSVLELQQQQPQHCFIVKVVFIDNFGASGRTSEAGSSLASLFYNMSGLL